MSFTAELEARHAEQWHNMTQHHFILSVADGSIADAAFRRWLVQDYLYVRGLLSFVGSLIAAAPHELKESLGQAVIVLSDELRLFERMAQSAGAELDGAEPVPACFNYLSFLDSVALRDDFASALCVYWALEKAYFDAWSHVATTAAANSAWQDFIMQWSKPAFGEYVTWLGACVDRLAAGSSPATLERMALLYLLVIRQEYAFWDIALNDEGWPL